MRNDRPSAFHWHAGCSKCRHLVFVAFGDQERTSPIHALCPYCLHAETHSPDLLVLHCGYGTIYEPPHRNLSDTVCVVAGMIAAVRTVKLPFEEVRDRSWKVNEEVRTAWALAEQIVEKATSQH